MTSVPRDERDLVTSAAQALGYVGRRALTDRQLLALAAALSIVNGRWWRHAEERQVRVAAAAYGAAEQQIRTYRKALVDFQSGGAARPKAYQDCIDTLNVMLQTRGGAARSAPPADTPAALRAHLHPIAACSCARYDAEQLVLL